MFAYGRICASVQYQLDQEDDAMRHEYGMPGGRPRGESADDARRRMELVRDEFPGWPPEDLLLATSPPLLRELADAAQRLQPSVPSLRPDRVLRQIAAHTWHVTDELPRDRAHRSYAGAGRGYLIETAFIAEADFLITPDPALQTAEGQSHRDEKTGREVIGYSLDGFVAGELPTSLDFEGIDAPAVLIAAVRRLPPRDNGAAGDEPGRSPRLR